MRRGKRSQGVVLVKLGGSLLTDKRGTEVFRPRITARVARELAAAVAAGRTVVLGHGAGSFGHAAARRHAVGAGPVPQSGRIGIAQVQDRTARLHRRVVDAMLRAGLPAFSLAPSSLATADRGRIGR